MKISVIGSGYVGLVTATCFAHSGNTVICRDVDESKIEKLKQGYIPFYEPGLHELVTQNIRKGRLIFTTDMDFAVDQSDFIFIAVGTPSDSDGGADLKFVLTVASEIGKKMNANKVVINKSTVPVGTGNKVWDAINEKLKEREVSLKVSVVSNPEFLKEGSAVDDFMVPDRIVIGADDSEVIPLVKELYFPFAKDENQIIIMDLVSAEITKYAANCFLATKISFMNDIANLCEKTGANIDCVRQGIGSDNRIGNAFLNAGIGYGGSCFPKDVKAMLHTAKNKNLEFSILSAVEQTNKQQKENFVQKITEYFYGKLEGKKLAVWGLSFKPRTDDMREAPSLFILEELSQFGAEIHVSDPVVDEKKCNEIWGEKVTYHADNYKAIINADALLILTEWDEYVRPDFDLIKTSMKFPVIFDGRNVYNIDFMQSRNIDYISVGRPMVSF